VSLSFSHETLAGTEPKEHLWVFRFADHVDNWRNQAATVPPQRGIFLSKTRRMRLNLWRFISEAFYEGRLKPEAGNEVQGLILNPDVEPALAPTGLRFISIEHEGCSLYGDDPPVENFAEFYRRIWEQIKDVWPRCLELGLDVVLDFRCWTRRERDAVRVRVATMGAQSRLYRVTCSEEEAWRHQSKPITALEIANVCAAWLVMRARWNELEVRDAIRLEWASVRSGKRHH
jgi:hypothetical protein